MKRHSPLSQISKASSFPRTARRKPLGHLFFGWYCKYLCFFFIGSSVAASSGSVVVVAGAAVVVVFGVVIGCFGGLGFIGGSQPRLGIICQGLGIGFHCMF